jgi:hypothetical protein
MGISLDRPFERRLVVWENSVNSKAITLPPGAAWNLYVPVLFTGATLKIQVWVERDANDPTTGEGRVDAWKDYDQGAITFVVDTVIDLTPNSLFGLEKVRFVSDNAESCAGELLMSS